jgi:formyl-CoA transferase
MAGALEGIRILEIANYISGPFASMLLADLGAEVIKIEMPGQGDPFRGWGDTPYSPTFCSMNRNKRSLSLNIQSVEGKEVFLRLARDADVVIENLRPGVLDRAGMGYEALRAANPRIVYCSITGYGSDGPYRERPGYDTIGQALGGLLSVLTDMEAPSGMGASLSDLLTGMYACYAVQGALLARERKGMGQKVETSLLQATLAFSGENAVRYLAGGPIPSRETRVHMAQVYALLDSERRPFVIHLSSPQKFWHGLAGAIGRPELKEDPRFANREARIRNYRELHAILAEKFATGPREHWLELLEQHDVPAAPLLNMAEVFADPQVQHNRMLLEMQHPRMGTVRMVNTGIRMSETPPQMALAPPVAGEHTGEILESLGYGEETLERWRERGVI